MQTHFRNKIRLFCSLNIAYIFNICNSNLSKCPKDSILCTRDLFYNGTAKTQDFTSVLNKDNEFDSKKLPNGYSITTKIESQDVEIQFICGHRPQNASYPPEIILKEMMKNNTF